MYYDGGPMSLDDLARDYWSMVDTQNKSAVVEYGNDIDVDSYQSGFSAAYESPTEYTGVESGDSDDMYSEAYYRRTGWNLNNLPKCKDSLLQHIKSPINGVTVPWLYIGMLFSSFCWHTEDNFLYSINYSHFGDVKQWYGVPGSEAKNFEKVHLLLTAIKQTSLSAFRYRSQRIIYSSCFRRARICYITWRHKFHLLVCLVSVDWLNSLHSDDVIINLWRIDNGIPVYKAQHEPRTFMITFAKAFHGGFSYGVSVWKCVSVCVWQ